MLLEFITDTHPSKTLFTKSTSSVCLTHPHNIFTHMMAAYMHDVLWPLKITIKCPYHIVMNINVTFDTYETTPVGACLVFFRLDIHLQE